MLKTIIIDDEAQTRQVLGKLLADYCQQVNVLATVSSVSEGIEAIKKYNPDLIFLDIEFPEQTGFELLEELPDSDFDVIFISGHSEYALKALKKEATDYLLKPFNIEEIEKAVAKVAQKREKIDTVRQAHVFLQKWKESSEHQIALASSDGFLFVKIKDIVYCKGDGAYTYFFLKNKERITVSKNLKEFETLLSDFGFFRIHKSYLINLSEMQKYVRGDGGYVVMSNGDSVDVSKRKKESFLSNLARV